MTDFVAAECEIRQLHARFVDAAWRKDAGAFANSFAKDGVWKIAGMEMRGREDIESTFARLLGACSKVFIIANAPLLDVQGDTATSRVYVQELAVMLDGATAMTLGIYYDSYVREDGKWLFARRHFSLQYRGPHDLSAPFVESPDYGPSPAVPGPDEPTLTRRKLD